MTNQTFQSSPVGSGARDEFYGAAPAQLKESQSAEPVRLEESQGALPIPMSNDYLFRALMQRNRKVLKALICSLLHLEPAAVTNVTILNPIELGEDMDDKTYILDIKVEINWYLLLNLELQVVNEKNWPERLRGVRKTGLGQNYEMSFCQTGLGQSNRQGVRARLPYTPCLFVKI